MLIFCAARLWAQQPSIDGVVVDAITGIPIANARVTLRYSASPLGIQDTTTEAAGSGEKRASLVSQMSAYRKVAVFRRLFGCGSRTGPRDGERRRDPHRRRFLSRSFFGPFLCDSAGCLDALWQYLRVETLAERVVLQGSDLA